MRRGGIEAGVWRMRRLAMKGRRIKRVEGGKAEVKTNGRSWKKGLSRRMMKLKRYYWYKEEKGVGRRRISSSSNESKRSRGGGGGGEGRRRRVRRECPVTVTLLC